PTDTLPATASGSDADGSAVTHGYVWKVNGTVVAGATGPTFDLAQAGHGDKGDTITIEATPNDGAANGTTATAGATVVDSAPVVDSVTIDQPAPHTNDLLTATVATHDADGAP